MLLGGELLGVVLLMRHTAVDGLDLALGFTLVLDTNGAALAGRVGGHYGGFVRGSGREWGYER